MEIKHRISVITPAEAERMVQNLFAGAHVDQRLLKSYAQDMIDDRWQMNGSPIVIGSDGRLLDGRIRLFACIKAKKSFHTLIVEGIDPEGFESIDSLRKRTLADVLHVRNEDHGRALAAALRVIWALANGGPRATTRTQSTMTLLALLEENPEIRSSIKPSLRAAPLMPHGVGTALHYLFHSISPAACASFFEALCEEGAGEPDDPARVLRETLVGMGKSGGGRKRDYILAVSLKAWKAHIEGKKVKILRYSPDREGFPELVGFSIRNGSALTEADTVPEPNAGDGAAELIKVRVANISPSEAKSILQANKGNRTLSATVTDKYCRDMMAGNWRLNGQTIKISSSGKLLDGQHRLYAAVKANVSFPAIIVSGLDERSFFSLDVGRKRSMSEVLKEYGELNTTTLAAALRWLWMMENDMVLANTVSPTNGEMLAILNRHPQVRESVRKVAGTRDMIGGGMAAALHVMFSQKDPIQADEFFARLTDGVNLTADHPILILRERFWKMRESRRIRVAEAERLALAVKAWNALRLGRPVQQLSWRNRGETRERLPEPV